MDDKYCHETQNIVENLYAISLDTGRGVTQIEKAAGCSSGALAITKKRKSSFTIRTAMKLAKAAGVDLFDLMKDPEEFKKEFLS